MLTAQSHLKKGMRDIDIATDVVPGSAPLLISLEVMRTLGVCLDIKMKKMWAGELSFQLTFPSSGHVRWQLIPLGKGWVGLQPTTKSFGAIIKIGKPTVVREVPETLGAAEATTIIPDEEPKSGLPKAEVKKRHIHLGPASDHKGTQFAGSDGDEFLNVFDLEFGMIAAGQSSEKGLIGRAVSLVKIGYRAIDTMLADLENKQVYSEEHAVGNEDSMQFQLQAMMHARAVKVRADSERLLWLGLHRPLRACTRSDFKMGDSVRLYMMGPRIREMRRQGIFRVVQLPTHHLVVESGTRVFKFLKFRVKLQQETIVPLVTSEKESLDDQNRPRSIEQQENSGLGESTDGRAEISNGGHHMTVMVMYPVVEKCERLAEQYRRNDMLTEAVNECHGEFWTPVGQQSGRCRCI